MLLRLLSAISASSDRPYTCEIAHSVWPDSTTCTDEPSARATGAFFTGTAVAAGCELDPLLLPELPLVLVLLPPTATNEALSQNTSLKRIALSEPK